METISAIPRIAILATLSFRKKEKIADAMTNPRIIFFAITIFLFFRTFERFAANLSKVLKNKKIVIAKKIILGLVIASAIFSFFLKDNVARIAILGMALMVSISFYLWICIKSVEKISM